MALRSGQRDTLIPRLRREHPENLILKHKSVVAIELTARKTEETATECTYVFGTHSATVGTVRVEKSTGDVEIVELSEMGDGPTPQFCLAQFIPRLQSYHSDGTYPDHERWPATA